MLELVGLTRRFGDFVAVDDLSLTVPPGVLFGLLGPNGAGKSTAIKMVFGLLRPDAGEVRWQDRPAGDAERARFGYLPEERGLYARMKVREQLVYMARLHGMGAAAAGASTDRWLERLGIAERAEDRAETLSLGNQQRVQLAAALVHEPELLVLDEPFSGLDPLAVDMLATVLAERVAAGVVVIFSSHQLDLVERLCDSVGILAGGRLVADGSVAQLREHGSRRTLRVVVRGAPPGWLDAISGARVLSDHDGDVLVTLEDPSRDQDVLAAAQRVGRVEHFGWLTPTLAELFREAVAA